MVTESVNAAGETVAPREVHHDAATGASYGVKSPVAEDDTTARMIEQSSSSRSHDRQVGSGKRPRFAMYAFFFLAPIFLCHDAHEAPVIGAHRDGLSKEASCSRAAPFC
jgi:hypothetical protein